MIQPMLDVGNVRKRVRQRIETVRREAAARRAAVDSATRDYDEFLEKVAVPTFRHVAAALRAEGLPFQLFTPAGSVRLSSEKSGDDFIEVLLDPVRDPVTVVGRTSHSRGNRLVTTEWPLREGAEVRSLTEEDVLGFVLQALAPFVER